MPTHGSPRPGQAVQPCPAKPPVSVFEQRAVSGPLGVNTTYVRHPGLAVVIECRAPGRRQTDMVASYWFIRCSAYVLKARLLAT